MDIMVNLVLIEMNDPINPNNIYLEIKITTNIAPVENS